MNLKYVFIVFFLFLGIHSINALDKDSLTSYINSYSEIDSNKVNTYNLLGRYYLLQEGDVDLALKYIDIGVDAAKEINKTKMLASLLSLRAYVKTNFTTDFEGSISDYYAALDIFKKENNLKEISTIYINLGNAYYNYGQLDDARKYFELLIEVANKTKNEEDLAIAHSNLGTIIMDDSLSIYHLLEAKSYYTKIGNEPEEATIDYTLINKKIDESLDVSEFERVAAISGYKRIKDVFKENGLNTFYLGCLISIGRELTKIRSLKEGYDYLLEAEKVGKEIQDYNLLKEVYNNLAINCDQRKDYRMEVHFLLKSQNIKDSIFKENKAEAIAEMQTKYDTEQKEAENKLLKTEKELDKAELKRKSSQQKMLLISLLVAVIVVAYVAYSLIQKKKTNKLLNEQNEEISSKNKIIEEKNKDITDSINYAQRIQNAILPGEKALANHVDSFIYYKPKDIVSGDFYWVKEMGDKVFFSVVDCTGHGVPGAFMSIIGFNSLNRIVDDLGITDTGLILDKLNDLVIESISHESHDGITIRDGMDLSFCCFDKKNKTIQYSGAHNSLYIVRTGEEAIEGLEPSMSENGCSLFEIKADKMAIGGTHNDTKYQTHNIQLKGNDTVYLFSDGYADQFGGPKGKKFMYKRFKQLILSVQKEAMPQQQQLFDKTIVDWQGDLDQLDDICLIGVKA